MRADVAEADRRREVREAARGWRRSGAVDETVLAAVTRAYPDDRVRLAPDHGVQPVAQPVVQPVGQPARVHYHYVIIDFAAAIEAGAPRAGSDAAEVRWVPVSELERYDTTDGLADMVHRAAHLAQGQALSQGG